MSRAFVKEDAEPAPIQWRKQTGSTTEGGRFPLTLSGANRLKAELKRLLKPAPVPIDQEERSPRARNTEIAQRIALLEASLSRAEIVDVRSLSGTEVRFGATVVLQEIETGNQVKYQIVGELEADLKLGRISVTSPLAQALIGREVSDLVQVQTPKAEHEYEIHSLLWCEGDHEDE